MENTQDMPAPNKQVSVQDPLQEKTLTIDVMVNVDETCTNDETAKGVPILSAHGTLRKMGFHLFFKDISHIFKLDDLGREVARIAIPAALALAADPLASLVDTAFVGRLGSVELAAVGVAIAIFNQVSKIAIYPLVSVTTSFVAEEDACFDILEEGIKNLEKASTMLDEMKESTPDDEVSDSMKSDSMKASCNRPDTINTCTELSKPVQKRKCIPSVSTALIVGAVLGIFQAILLITTAKFLLHIMGVKSVRG